MRRLGVGAVALVGTIALGFSILCAQDDGLSPRARELHRRAIVLDTHIDVPYSHARETDYNVGERHTEGHADLPRMRAGGLDGGFFSIYIPATVTGPEAVKRSLQLIAWTRQQVAMNASQAVLATSAADVQRAHKQGKLAILMGMEGGHMIDDDLAVLRMYAELGIRYLTLTHSRDTNWAGSSGQDGKNNGLNEFGKDVVRELNRLGVMVDLSHVSDRTFFEALEVTRAPVLLSHSSCRALCDHPRNVTDDMLKALARNGGVIQITFVDSFVSQELRDAEEAIREERQAKMEAVRERFPHDAEARQAAIQQIRREYRERLPKVSWERIVDHIDHAVKVAGIDHVGLGSDFDGATMPEGMDDVSMLPRITQALLDKGYAEKDVEKVLGENLLRLMAEVEHVSRRTRSAGKRGQS